MATDFTYVNQVDEEFLLDILTLTSALDGYIESIKPIENDPGMYSIIVKLPQHWARGWYQLSMKD